MPLNATTGPVIDGKAVGDVMPTVARLRAAKTVEDAAREAAFNDENLQRQINALVKQLAAAQPALKLLQVTNSLGSLIAWIGSYVTAGVTYMGAWFRQIYIGGTDASTAKIVADASGNVTITGATITINSSGVITSIANVSTPPFGVLSLKSTDIASGYWTGIHPFGIDLVDNLGNSLGYLRSGGGQGHIALSNVAGTKTIQMATGGAGSPAINMNNAGATATISPAGWNINSQSSVDGSGNLSAQSYAAGGTPGIDTTDTLLKTVTPTTASVVSGISSSTTGFVDGVTISTTTISYTPGATSATFVSGVGTTSTAGIIAITPATTTAVTGLTPTTQTDTYTKGLRTA